MSPLVVTTRSDAAPGVPPTESGNPISLSGYARAWWSRVRSGELGNLPIIVGLVLIVVIFTSLNPRFLSSVNVVNLIIQTAPLAGIAAVLLTQRKRREASSLPTTPIAIIAFRLGFLLILGLGVVYFASLTRGSRPWRCCCSCCWWP